MGFLVRSGGLAPEDPNCSDNEEFHDRPADEATTAAMSRTEPPALRALVWRMPSNGATKTWLTLRIPDTSPLASRALSTRSTIRRAMRPCTIPNAKNRDTPGELAVARSGRLDLDALFLEWPSACACLSWSYLTDPQHMVSYGLCQPDR